MMQLKDIHNKIRLHERLTWVVKNAIVLLLAANLLMNIMTYRKAKEASDHAQEAEYSAELAQSAAELAQSAADEAARQAEDAADAAHHASASVSDLQLSTFFHR